MPSFFSPFYILPLFWPEPPDVRTKDTYGRVKMALNLQSEMVWLSPHPDPNWLVTSLESGDLSKLILYLQDESQDWQSLLHGGVSHLKAVTYRRAL